MSCEKDVKLNPLLKVILEGLYDEECVLSKLRGCQHLMKNIWRNVVNFNKSQIFLPDTTVSFDYMKNQEKWGTYPSVDALESALYLAPISNRDDVFQDEPTEIAFPEPSNININMMPFIVGQTFKECR